MCESVQLNWNQVIKLWNVLGRGESVNKQLIQAGLEFVGVENQHRSNRYYEQLEYRIVDPKLWMIYRLRAGI